MLFSESDIINAQQNIILSDRLAGNHTACDATKNVAKRPLQIVTSLVYLLDDLLVYVAFEFIWLGVRIRQESENCDDCDGKRQGFHCW